MQRKPSNAGSIAGIPGLILNRASIQSTDNRVVPLKSAKISLGGTVKVFSMSRKWSKVAKNNLMNRPSAAIQETEAGEEEEEKEEGGGGIKREIQDDVDEINYRTRKMSVIDVDNRRMSINDCRKLSIVAQLNSNQRRQSIRRQSVAARQSIVLQQIPARKQSVVGQSFTLEEPSGNQVKKTISSLSNGGAEDVEVEIYNYRRMSRLEHNLCGVGNLKDGLLNRVASDPEMSTEQAQKIILQSAWLRSSNFN